MIASTISATTTSTWVLAPRAMVKAPATGQRSIATVSRRVTIAGCDSVRGDPFLDHRRDLVAPLAAVEDAVMADVLGDDDIASSSSGRLVAMSAPPWSGRARKYRRARPRSRAARCRVIAAGSTAPAAMHHLALGQQMALEHDVDRLEVEFGGHVADRAIFVVEVLGRVGALVVALRRDA